MKKTPKELIEEALNKYNIIAIGELHHSRASIKFIMDNIDTLFDNGVKYLFTEKLTKKDGKLEPLQSKRRMPYSTPTIFSDLNRTTKSKQINIRKFDEQPPLEFALKNLSLKDDQTFSYRQQKITDDSKNGVEFYYTAYNLVQLARRKGITIIGIDVQVKVEHTPDGWVKRAASMNQVAKGIIKGYSDKFNGTNKAIIFAGIYHVSDFQVEIKSRKTEKVNGLATLFKCPSFFIHELDMLDIERLEKNDNNNTGTEYELVEADKGSQYHYHCKTDYVIFIKLELEVSWTLDELITKMKEIQGDKIRYPSSFQKNVIESKGDDLGKKYKDFIKIFKSEINAEEKTHEDRIIIKQGDIIIIKAPQNSTVTVITGRLEEEEDIPINTKVKSGVSQLN